MITPIFEAFAGSVPGPDWKLGARHLAANGKRSRVVVVPRDEEIGPGRPSANGGQPIRALATRSVTVEFHIWGPGVADVEAVVNAIILYMRRQAGASARGGRGRWLTSEEAGWLTLGECYLLPLTFDIPVADPRSYHDGPAVGVELGPPLTP